MAAMIQRRHRKYTKFATKSCCQAWVKDHAAWWIIQSVFSRLTKDKNKFEMRGEMWLLATWVTRPGYD